MKTIKELKQNSTGNQGNKMTKTIQVSEGTLDEINNTRKIVKEHLGVDISGMSEDYVIRTALTRYNKEYLELIEEKKKLANG